MLIQMLGLAGVFVLLPPLFWALQLLTCEQPPGLRGKLLLAPLAVLFLAGALSALPIVRSVAQRVGRAESDDIFGTHESELEVDLKELHGDEFEEAEDQIKKVMEGFPKVEYEINTFLAERISETLSGYTEPVVVNIFGDDLEELDKKGDEVLALVKEVPGSEEVQWTATDAPPR